MDDKQTKFCVSCLFHVDFFMSYNVHYIEMFELNTCGKSGEDEQ